MQLTNIFTIFAGLLSVSSAFQVDELDNSLDPRGLPCAHRHGGAHIIALGGQGTTDGNLGYLANLTYAIRDSIPGSNIRDIGYPVGMLGGAVIEYAIPILQKHIQKYAAACPKTKMILVSYSIGAAATMDTLCGAAADGSDALASRYRHNIIANLVYGDLTFVSGLKYDHGTCKDNHGLVPRQKPGACFPYGGKTRSWCDAGDVNCCSGDNPAVHFEYPQKYDDAALQFALNRWHRFGN